MFCTEWLLACRSRIIYGRQPDKVFYVLPVESILGKLPFVPMAIQERFHIACCSKEDFVGAAFDTREGAGDGSRWWYINT